MNKRACVLVVEDDPKIKRIFELKLKLEGYDIITARDGLEAINQVETHSPDILLLDIMLPVMNGLEVLQKLRGFSQIPVITFSANMELGQKALKLGANAFVPKPFNPDVMIRKVRQVLQKD
jgi:DNA-binding response OmpR family regulator